MRTLALTFAFYLIAVSIAQAGSVRVAVAANFRTAMFEIAEKFEAEQGHSVTLSAGSSGQLFAQISNGAPYDVFLSADRERPEKLVEAGLARPESRFTYVIGRLFLMLPRAGRNLTEEPDLSGVRRLAIANPRTAPYGAAALQVMPKLAFPSGAPQIAETQSVAGVNAAVAAGAVDAGFAAFSTISGTTDKDRSGWLVPAEYHAPILQDAVLLNRAVDNPAAIALLDWLRSDRAKEILLSHGYDVP